MRRFGTALMTMAASALLLGSASIVLAQDGLHQAPSVPHIYLYESTQEDTTFFNASYTPEAVPDDVAFFEFDQLPGDYGIPPIEGDGAAVVNWQIKTHASWGGSMGLVHALPNPENLAELTPEEFFDAVDLYDVSDFTHIHLWYNVLQPADPGMSFRLKLHDASLGIGTEPSNQTEDWNAQHDNLLDDASNTWQEWVVPLENLGINVNPTTTGFTRPGCSTGSVPTEPSGCWSGLLGNEVLDLDKISGISFEFFAGSSVHGLPDSLNAGVVAFDQLYVTGVRYDLLHAFDTAPGGWNNGSGSSSRTVVADTVEGTGALEFTYNVVGSESWGGSADVQGESPGEFFPDLTERSHLSLFYKVVEPVVKGAESDNARFTFKLFDNSTGTREEWHYTTYDVLGDSTGRWQRLLIPLDGFTLPSWVAQGDGELNLDNIEEWQFQVIVDAGNTASGKILFDRLSSYGVSVVDETPPVAVEGLDVSAGEYVNLVTWNDVDGEMGETYDLYYSLSPINSLDDDGVLLAASGIAENTEVFEHRIFHPVTDGEVSFYYAIRATDAAGNQGELAGTGAAVQNTAKGLPTITLGSPSGFDADGNLVEWQGMTPFQLRPNGDLGHVPEGFGIDDDDDLSVDIYLAVDSEALYFAMDVTDNVYVPVPDDQGGTRAPNAWLYDGAEIYIGLYNEVSPRHAGTRTSGDEPDYKFYVYPQRVWSDNRDNVVTPGENYYFQPKSTGDGYIVEARLPHETYVHLLDSDTGTYQDPFTPVNGMRIPLDLVVMDNDEPGSTNREGILAYSFNNEDNSHGRPRNWFYTWIGNQMTVSSEDGRSELPQHYVLHQNYPNPFNPSTLISYELPHNGLVTLKVFNMLGQEVMTLVNGTQNAGRYEVRFDARDLASGVYFYQLQSGSQMMAKKMLLIR